MEAHLLQHNYLIVLLSIAYTNALIILGVVTLLMLVFLFFISGAEVALFSLSYKDISVLKTKQHEAAKRIIVFLENPKNLLGAITIASSVLSIGIVICSSYVLDATLPMQSVALLILIKIVVIGTLLILVGNILPKVWAAQNNLRFAYLSSFVIEIVYLLFGNISKPLIRVSDNFNETFGTDEKSKMDGELLDYAIDKLPENEATPEEKQILKGIRKFGNTTVKQVMKQRLDVSGIEYTTTLPNVIAQAAALHYSRLPVYSNTLDELKGIIYTKDLLPYMHEGEGYQWQTLIRPCVYVHEQKLIEDLLQDFRHKHIHIAIVVDEFGGTSGIITLEDILEEIVGEIKDEFDEEDNTENKIDENNYVFDGKIMLPEVCKIMGIPTDTFDQVKGDSDSLGGLILELIQELPAINQTHNYKQYQFTVLELEHKRIKKVAILKETT